MTAPEPGLGPEHEAVHQPTAAASAHVDTFVRDNLPPLADWPELRFSGLPDPAYPARLNCVTELLDHWVQSGVGGRPALHHEGQTITYAALQAWTNRIAAVLVDDLALVPGGRVLLRGFNSPAMVAAWLAVVKAGGVVVTTMPLLRARELVYTVQKARVDAALCDARLAEELQVAEQRLVETPGSPRPRTVFFGGDGGPGSLEELAAHKSGGFSAVATAADDPCLIAFTSGTTGQPKGAVHCHRDILATCDTFSRHVLRPTAKDVFAGTPPVAFTYGLGGLLLFPFRAGASVALLEAVSPPTLLQLVQEARVSTLFTSPTMYRALLPLVDQFAIGSLHACVSAGEPLALATFEAWRRATGVAIIDGLGSTELLHIFISSSGADVQPGATGRVVPGYEARVVDDAGEPVPAGQVGRLAVRGPTGCRYLADPLRQRDYVRDGWNYTGDAYVQDERGYFWFQARADDMIISAGYNIAGPEIENVLMEHPRVKECAVVGVPDRDRGHVVKAFVVLHESREGTPELARELQDFVKMTIAPYKYPRAIEFCPSLPRTETGKVQRYKLRDLEQARITPG